MNKTVTTILDDETIGAESESANKEGGVALPSFLPQTGANPATH
jgi:hypothetical protein